MVEGSGVERSRFDRRVRRTALVTPAEQPASARLGGVAGPRVGSSIGSSVGCRGRPRPASEASGARGLRGCGVGLLRERPAQNLHRVGQVSGVLERVPVERPVGAGRAGERGGSHRYRVGRPVAPTARRQRGVRLVLLVEEGTEGLLGSRRAPRTANVTVGAFWRNISPTSDIRSLIAGLGG
jgi:hypothetical protein